MLIEVDVTGNVLYKSGSPEGMLVDFGDIKGYIDQFDHTNLNESLGLFVVECKVHPTAERFAKFLAKSIRAMSYGDCTVSVKVHEAKGQWAQYTEK